jgi:transposase
MPLKLSGLEQALCAQVQAAPEQTLAQLCDWVRTAHGVQVSVTAMWKTLDRLGLTLKKRPLLRPNRRVRT